MTTTLTMQKIEDGYFDTAKRVEEPVLQYTGQFAKAVAKYVPPRPTFMASMPTMTEVVDHTLKFRKRFVDEQATFVRHFVKAMDPVVTKFDAAPAPKPAAKPAAAKPVRKATPRRKVA